MNDIQDVSSEAPKTTDSDNLSHIDQSVTSVKTKTKKELLHEAKVLTKRTENLKFRITPAMIAWCDCASAIMSNSPSDITQSCGISRENWYRWIKLEGFEDWFYSQYKGNRKRWIPQLDKMGMIRASKNFDYWKAMNQKAGELLDDQESQPQQRISILGGMTVQTVNNIKQDTTTNEQDT